MLNSKKFDTKFIFK